MAIIEEKIKKFKAKSEVIKAQKMEDTAKLDFTLAKIEALKRKVYESQYEVVSLIKKVKTSNNHQKLIAKPWNRPTCSSWGGQRCQPIFGDSSEALCTRGPEVGN